MQVFLISFSFLFQALTGLHLRAGVVVAILTLCNLFIGWTSYMNLGYEHCNFRRYEQPNCIILSNMQCFLPKLSYMIELPTSTACDLIVECICLC